MAQTLYLMRHGETLFNQQKRVQGWCDSPLTETGIEQAKQARDYFQRQGILFDRAYSSTQERATDTLKLITDLPYRQLKGLKEMNFGIFEAQPELLLPKFRPGGSSFEDLLVPYGGEDIYQVGKRVHDTIVEILAKERAQTNLMVSHGAALYGLILKLEQELPQGFRFGNCAICQFDYSGSELNLVSLINPLTDQKIDL
ncbi:histidine phosphatase family protein [Streptococcus caviae]|uniref:histidine phosphatase family protein n=1 Tax=Streptococcus sp. 'caviae' TaxID=1915004 RepID=UPI00094BBA78|nr:histidine phosphatase family protein [Streptococcus sp. 'caviae']OLN82650.1 histidine phosphatase family protein [Streptococcus sp. 'caviae']